MTQAAIFPPPLRPGDCIAVVAPASSPQRDALERGIASLTDAGFRVKQYRDLCRPTGYLSGSDAERAAELNQALADPETNAVIAARGGYGLARILDRIDYGALVRSPKIIAGYSDLTALHAAVRLRTGLATFHAPHVVDWQGPESDGAGSIAHFLAATAGESESCVVRVDPNHPDATPALEACRGVARGPLVGGNLAVLCGLIGAPYDIDAAGAILFLEDCNEPPYRVDRMLAQLKLSGKLDAAAGFALGYFSNCLAGQGGSAADVLSDYLTPLGKPVLAGLPVGHALPNLTLPLGALCEIDPDRGRLEVLQRCVP
ncbi:putative murein peptide carboxypeptidase [Pirellulimonas nuda]|uniref:Putative murein peptide carboxypeptidase n=1 Tax=Pirellulimonas nuda TaxID=2528009 RepID=A0A518DAP9_9BACT|nr:LD-carboxypeptidase [Pirellulimonas nuda]QDU88496.1 putative murein peptide carboxypeptidase [Pirellulimonas nuda]